MSGTDLRAEVKRIKEIEDGIIEISKAMKEIKSGRLRQTTIVALLHDYTGLPKKTINAVLEGLEKLADTYLIPPKKEEPNEN